MDGGIPMSTITYAKAINEALAIELERDPNVVVLGEDIGPGGGVFTITAGLHERFGGKRIIDTPIAEAGFVGLATGAAIAGLRPVVELMFVEFALVAADQLFNQAGKLRFMSGGQFDVPITIRTQQGIAGGGGPQHSQSLDTLFAHIPGFAVAVPATAADAKGLTATAIRMDDPTVVIEHKGLYFTKGEVPDGEHVVPFGQAAVRRQGTDVTLIGYSRAVQWCLEAAEQLAADGISTEVIDLRTLVPLDMDTVAESVSRTSTAVVVTEAPGFASMASEIAAQVTERCWGDLDAPVLRVTGLDMAVPYARTLEQYWLPSVADIVLAARRATGREALPINRAVQV
jgi:pyruvate dehydrogenase E1 component beta subunit